MLWHILAPSVSIPQFQWEDVCEVLYEFDGPKIFTTKDSDGLLRLWYESVEDRESKKVRFLVAPVSEAQIDNLKLGRRTVFDLLRQNWLWVVDSDYSFTPLAAWVLRSLEEVPANARPDPQATLYPQHMPLLSYRLIGPGLVEGNVPASVISRAVNSPAAALKRIFESINKNFASGRPEESFRRSYDLPATRFSYNSFEVSFAEPASDQLDLDAVEDDVSMYREGSIALEQGLSWLQDCSGDEPGISMLEALKELTPPAHGQIERVELRGRLLRSNKVVSLNRSHRKVITDLIRNRRVSDSELVSVEGRVRELDKDNLSFTLRDRLDGAPELRCVFDEDKYDDVIEYFNSDALVRAVGRLKSSKGILEIGDIQLFDGVVN